MPRSPKTWSMAAVACFAFLPLSPMLADHKLDPQHFDHVMYSERHRRGVIDRQLALECDGHFASIDPGGFMSLDIGHRKHFRSAEGPDLAVFTRGGVAYEVLVASIDDADEWTWVGESTDETGEFDVARAGEYQYVRIKNRARTELKLDCVVAQHLVDHPVPSHHHDD